MSSLFFYLFPFCVREWWHKCHQWTCFVYFHANFQPPWFRNASSFFSSDTSLPFFACGCSRFSFSSFRFWERTRSIVSSYFTQKFYCRFIASLLKQVWKVSRDGFWSCVDTSQSSFKSVHVIFEIDHQQYLAFYFTHWPKMVGVSLSFLEVYVSFLVKYIKRYRIQNISLAIDTSLNQ